MEIERSTGRVAKWVSNVPTHLLSNIPPGMNATVTARVYSGEIRASFPLPAADQASRRQKRYRFGSGSALVELETFSGEVQLLRPADLLARLDRMIQKRPEKDHDQGKESDHDLPE